MDEQLVTIVESITLPQMDLIRSRLDAEGIHTFIPGETGAFMWNRLGLRVTPLGLQVPASQAERALEVLRTLSLQMEMDSRAPKGTDKDDEQATIAESCSLNEMDVLRSRLEAEGISVFVPEDQAAALNYPPAGLPLRLQVPASQAERAVEVLGMTCDAQDPPDPEQR